MSLLDAMKMLVLVWDEVTEKTIQNCFKQAGFTEITDDSLSFDDLFSSLKDIVCQLSRMDEGFKDISVEDITSFDDSLPVTKALTSDEDILTDIMGDDTEHGHKDEEEEAPVLVKPATSQLRGAIDNLMNYSMMIDTTELKELMIKASRLVESEVRTTSRQAKLTDFFTTL